MPAMAATTEPEPVVLKSEFVMEVIARFDVVACVPVAFTKVMF